MTKKKWKIGDVGYFFFTYLWQTMKATVTMTTNDYLVSFMEANIYGRCISCIEWLIKKGYFPKEYLV